MENTDENQYQARESKLESLKLNEKLLRKVYRFAQFESEIELGVNPTSTDQAKARNFTEEDFGYIKKVHELVEKRMRNPNWLLYAIELAEPGSVQFRNRIKGVKFNDELFKAGRGILESFLDEPKPIDKPQK